MDKNDIEEEPLKLEMPSAQNLVLVSEIFPDHLIILPVSNRPIFPGVIMPLVFKGEQYMESINWALEHNNGLIGASLIKTENKRDFFASELHEVGTILKIYKMHHEGDSVQIFIQALQRFKYIRTKRIDSVLKWEVKYYLEKEKVQTIDELRPYTMAIMSNVKELLELNQIFQEQLKIIITQLSYDKPEILIDLVASMLTANKEKLQEILETIDLIERSRKLLILLKEEIEMAMLQENIEQQIEEKISKQQKEFFLREQLKIIKQELGLEKDDKAAEIEKIEERLKQLKLTEEAATVINEEIDKLNILEPSSPEFHVTRSYLNVLTELPWGIYSKDSINIKKARKILDEQHYGLDDVKDLILEFVSTIIKRGKVSGSIICLVGPPGVGKTSIGKSIADALGRQFYRFSVGGMSDEAEIKGHRRTYIGAMPGKIIQSLKRTGTSNPVIMIDEIDKIGMSYKGDPASAFLEVLDPEQNKDFLDHYLDVRYDLSKILFITTANQLDTIPHPLLDRMEIIKLSGYILQEKVEIAKRYLVPRQLEEHGLSKKEMNITDKALSFIVEHYAREAGVRGLENQVKKIMRKVTLLLAEKSKKSFRITEKNVEEFLGKPIFTTEELYERDIPGVTLGLAWTSMGGTTLYIEASAIKSKGSGFKQTGQLGHVMQESSEIAYSYVRSEICKNTKIKSFFDEYFVHMHVPEGATPKDGPSAGITMALALYSLAINKSVPKNIAMTGELTLTGKVLPIGGVREKIIAARRVGIKEIILPKENRRDYDELPDFLKESVKIYFANYFEDVLKVVFKKTRK